MKSFLVVNNPKTWPIAVEGVEIVSAKDYLSSPVLAGLKRARVFNACREYRYQAKGYYVSLLAEARGHRVVPSVKTIQDLKVDAVVRILSEELDEIIRKSLEGSGGSELTFDLYFGQTPEPRFQKVATELAKLFEAPFLRARFTPSPTWTLRGLRAISIGEIPEDRLPFVQGAATRYFKRQGRPASAQRPDFALDLAILVNPEEQDPPSNAAAIQKFVQAGERAGFSTEIIGKSDYGRIGEFDALFLRETSMVNNHTYRFASRAQSEGMAVIDEPQTILRATNKVFLSELMRNVGVKTLDTMIVYPEMRAEVQTRLGLPCVLKQPDSSFSRGVHKASTADELNALMDEMFKTSDLLIAQRYTPTDFDWRIGVLDGAPLFACKYFMARGHWQIYNWAEGHPSAVEGAWETLPVAAAPKEVIDMAVKAANAIGQGLFGVDIKEADGEVLLVEVNDNPNVDAGVEDQVLGDALYDRVIAALKGRIERRMVSAFTP